VYFDTSALVPLYVPEALTSIAVERLSGAEAAYVSWLTEVEVTSALAQKTRTKELGKDDARRVLEAFRAHLRDKAYEVLPLTREAFALASTALGRFDTPLRSLDALHLACCQLFDLTLLTADAGLARGAKLLRVPHEHLALP